MRIEQHILNGMNPQEKAEYDIWEELLESRGFEILEQYLNGYLESNHAILQNPNSWDQHVYSRGFRDALLLVLNLEQILEAKVMETVASAEEEEDLPSSIEL